MRQRGQASVVSSRSPLPVGTQEVCSAAEKVARR